MKTMIVLLASFMGIVTLNGCEKLVKTSWVYYDESYCADPWGNNSVQTDEKKENIETHFKDKGIKIFKVEILDDRTPESCFSCRCKTGNRIKCKIKERDVTEMENEGFYQ